MAQYFCPLCKQEVSRVLYEKITGVWEEKEEKLRELKEKEKKLAKKGRDMLARFSADRKKYVEAERVKLNTELARRENVWEREWKKQREALKKKAEVAEAAFKRKLARETNKILREEKEKAKVQERSLKEKFQESAAKMIEKGRKGLLKEQAALQKQERIQMNKYRKLNEQYNSLQSKSQSAQEKAAKKIASLEEQLKKDKTPQVLGLLEEGVFLEKLKLMFPSDRFDHPGKGGDIVHHIMDKQVEIGTIVYELKKVSTFNKSHVVQAFEAKSKRNADYGILVTNAKRSKDDFGFSVTKGIIVIHPAAALVLVNIIRDHLIKIAKLKLSAEKRRKTVQAVLDYIQGPAFKNGIEAIIEDTKDLYLSLTKEVKDHIKYWEIRINKYRDIQSGAHNIDTRVVRLLASEAEGKRAVLDAEIVPIALPSKID